MVKYTDVKQAQDAYPPGKYEKFFFRYFSYDTRKKDRWLSWLFVLIESVLMIWGSVCIILDRNALIPTLLFAGLLIALAILWMISWFIHQARIKNIADALNMSVRYYNQLYT